MKKLEYILHLFMYELEKFLLTKKNELVNIAYQSDEANTDRPLKEYLKYILEKYSDDIILSTKVGFVNLKNSEVKLDIENFKILSVLLPENINEDIKRMVKKQKNNNVYTNPDICLKILYDGQIYYETIELKSTKSNIIPGSSVRQILPEEWVIFIKHSKLDIDIATGKYVNSINSRIQFPDRSPRPQVSFEELKKWNEKNRRVENLTLYYNALDDEKDKYFLITDWQAFLTEKWIDMLLNSSSVKNREPWFNNNMRKFIIKFLNYYDTLNKEQQEKLKRNISSLIKNDDY